MQNDWYLIDNVASIDTPALVIYPERVQKNISTIIGSIDAITRLRPHVKTHKSAEVTKMMLEAGIKKFKCATIAEAEMLAMCSASDVLLAYQPVGPKVRRLLNLVHKYPGTSFSCLIDNRECASIIAQQFAEKSITLTCWIDLNVGMNRTGISPADAGQLYSDCLSLNGIDIIGLHAYDGHLRDVDISVRTKRSDEAFAHVTALQHEIMSKHGKKLTIVAGGTPTYSIHSKRKGIECSPGTFIYWDTGYQNILTEQDYLFSAIVVSRIISIPSHGMICIDLGHKAIASENPLNNRVTFLNAPNLQPIGHSEEHMVLKADDGKAYQVGDVLYGIPFHVCPTVALHDRAAVVTNHQVTTYWEIISRNRRITV